MIRDWLRSQFLTLMTRLFGKPYDAPKLDGYRCVYAKILNGWFIVVRYEGADVSDDRGRIQPSEPWPRKRVVPCAFTLGDVRCGYTGKIDPPESCDGSLEDCQRHDNVRRFGGYPNRPTMPPNETHREGEI